MNATLCPRCGWHVDRCKCAGIRAQVFAEVADHFLARARVGRRTFGADDELAGIYDDTADYFADLAEREVAKL